MRWLIETVIDFVDILFEMQSFNDEMIHFLWICGIQFEIIQVLGNVLIYKVYIHINKSFLLYRSDSI